MKKLFSSVLALAMCCAIATTAFAEDTVINQDTDDKTGSTAVTFNVDPTYTVTIPGTVTLEKTGTDAVTYEQDLTITADAGMRLKSGESVQVTMASDFTMNSIEGSSLTYTVTANDQEIKNNGVVATFTTNTASQNSTLHFAANDPEYAGNYSDTVTFTLSVINN